MTPFCMTKTYIINNELYIDVDYEKTYMEQYIAMYIERYAD